jgi:hypothetical protein
MTQATPKPWALVLAGASLVPPAAYVAFLAADTFVCGFGHAVVIGMLAVVLLPQALVAALAAAAVLAALWRAGFTTERIARAIAALTIAASLAGTLYAVYLGHDGTFCRIDL